MKKSFWLDVIIATTFTFLVMWGILKITELRVFNAFDSIGKALEDIELTDYVFSHIRPQPELDTNIVVVNIGNLSRGQIAEQIEIISQYGPKVIGIDGFFNCKGLPRDTFYCPPLRDSVGNARLSQAIKNAGNVVMVSKLLQSAELAASDIEDVYDSLAVSDPMFRDVALAEGFASLETDAAFQEDVKTCRTFNPSMMVNGKRELAFSVQLAMLYDSVKANRFLARDNFSEIINYRGNMADFYGQSNFKLAFYAIDVDQVFEGAFLPGMIQDKIVIFGFLGGEFGDPSWEDKFYTPLNLKMAGKANPDMFGVIIHANIISMILKEDFINKMTEWQEIIMAIILCFLNVALFSLIHIKLPDWYDGITKLLQVIEILLLSFIMVEVFDLYSFKLEITVALAAIALAGDSYEVYVGVVKNVVNRLRNRGFKGLFTKRKKKVLTS